MTRPSVYVDVLLGDVFDLAVSFLSGFDLLRLSHTNRRIFHQLLAANGVDWQRRQPPIDPANTSVYASAKARYFQFTSVRFLGREIAKTTQRDRGGAVEVWSRGLPAYWLSGSFSLDITFALLPSDAHTTVPTYIGGILLGAQSVPWSTKRWAENHQQFVHIDPQRNLYCSVLDQKPIVAENLELERWYRVALVFDRAHGTLPTQRVYVDGVLVDERIGSLHSEWWNLRFGQVGSGCISGESPGMPVSDFLGWYGLHGIVDECRLWSGVLFQPVQCEGDSCRLEWSLRESGCDPLGFASRVQCTRVEERVCIDVRDLDEMES